jgi:hypothetical protein
MMIFPIILVAIFTLAAKWILAGTFLTKKSIFLGFTIKTQEFFSKASSLYFSNSVWDKKSKRELCATILRYLNIF